MKRMIDSELIEALGTDIKFDGTGNVMVGKNLEVGGNVFTLNGKKWGIMPVYTTIDNNTSEKGFIIYSDRPGPYNPAPGVNQYYIKGIYADSYGDVSVLSVSTNKTDWYSVENDILYIKNQEAYNNFQKGTINLGIEKQDKLYRHKITLNGIYVLMYNSTSNLEVNSVTDLRTIMKISSASNEEILPVCASDATSMVTLVVNTSLCQVDGSDVTTVSDTVTPL